MKNLTLKPLLTLVDDVLNGRWKGDTSKPIMIWFWDNADLDAVREHFKSIRELALFQEHPASFEKDYTKGFWYHRFAQQLEPKFLYDCMELIENTGLPLVGLVNDYEKEACEKKGITIDMDSFVNYQYIGKTMQEWLAEATAVDEDGQPQLPPVITGFVSDEQFKDLFFYNDDESAPIDSDKRYFSPDAWNNIWRSIKVFIIDEAYEEKKSDEYNTAIEHLIVSDPEKILKILQANLAGVVRQGLDDFCKQWIEWLRARESNK